jgi:hypothetical protein
MKLLVRALLTALSVLSFSSTWSVPALASDTGEKPYYYIPAVPEQMEMVDFYLITVGIGEDLAARYGHTGIRVVNHVDNTDAVFNWGKFHFDDIMFPVRFYRGDLNYSMGVRTYKTDLDKHVYEERKVYQEKLNLNVKQKRELLETIAENAKPENREFKYQYWFKNCSTIPRDYLDAVTGGEVKKLFTQQGAGLTFRDYVRSNLSLTPGMILVLDLIMNSRIDREISKWEEMFLPGKLRAHLMTLNATNVDGTTILGMPLLSRSEVLADFPETYRSHYIDYVVFGFFLAVLLMAAAFYATRQKLRLLGFVLLGFGFGGGFFGTVMTANWIFSGHPDIWHNANLLLLNPFDAIFAVIGWKVLRSGKAIKDRFPFKRAGEYLAWLHVALFCLLVLLKLTGVVEQNVFLTIVVFGLPVVASSLLFLKFARLSMNAPEVYPTTQPLKGATLIGKGQSGYKGKRLKS